MDDTTYYARNRGCHCARCRCRGLTGAAVLITIGVLFLLQEFWVISFDRSWPVLLIVIGAFMLLSRTAPMGGHISRYGTSGPGMPGVANPQVDPWAGSGTGGGPAASLSSSGPDQPGNEQVKP
jgi:hypothetical protein